jgi:hypothetical protein
MANKGDRELLQMARQIFGREIDATRIEAFRARLPHMARVKALLEDWEERICETEPVTVYQVPVAAEERRGGA